VLKSNIWSSNKYS